MLNYEILQEAGVEYKAALKRFADKADIYEKYIRKFSEDTHYEQAKEAFKNNDHDELLKTVHPIKGIVGTLGMNQLYQDADDVVQAIRENRQKDITSCFQKFAACYERTTEILSRV